MKLRWKVLLLCLTSHAFPPTLCLLWQMGVWEKKTRCFFSLCSGLHCHKLPKHSAVAGQFLLDLLIGCVLFLLLFGRGTTSPHPFPEVGSKRENSFLFTAWVSSNIFTPSGSWHPVALPLFPSREGQYQWIIFSSLPDVGPSRSYTSRFSFLAFSESCLSPDGMSSAPVIRFHQQIWECGNTDLLL